MDIILWSYSKNKREWVARKLVENAEIVWVERAYDIGQVEILMPLDPELISILQDICIVTRPPTVLRENKAIVAPEYEGTAMLIEEYQPTYQTSDGQRIRLLGRSFEAIFERRVLLDITENQGEVSAQPLAVHNKYPHEIINTLISEMFRNITNCPSRYVRGVNIIESQISGTYSRISRDYEGENMLDAIQDLREKYKLVLKPSWRQIVNYDSSSEYLIDEVEFIVSDGVDYTEDNIIALSVDNEDIIESEYEIDITKSVTDVIALGTESVEGEDSEYFTFATNGKNENGLYRSEKFADLRFADGDQAAITKFAESYLSLKKQAFSATESNEAHYKAGIDYHLGDKIIIKDSFGNIGKVRCTELTFVSDNEGDRIIPTFDLWEDMEIIFCDKTGAEFRTSDDLQIIVRGG